MKNESLGERLRRLRVERNIGIEEIARRVNVSSSTYREWENGRAIRGEPYIKLGDVFEISLEELITGEKGRREVALLQLDKLEDAVKNLRSEILRLA